MWTTMSSQDDRGDEEKQGTLYHGVLFRARGVFEGYVRNRGVATYEVRTLAMYMEQICGIPKKHRVIEQSKHGGGGEEKERGRLRTDLLITLENVKPPPDERLASLRRLVVFEQGARSVRMLDRVRRGREQARRREIRLGLVFGGW
jgi:hypothetical protein